MTTAARRHTPASSTRATATTPSGNSQPVIDFGGCVPESQATTSVRPSPMARPPATLAGVQRSVLTPHAEPISPTG